MKADRIFETVLYADDLPAARAFYEGALGLELIVESALMLAFRLPGSVLLVFDPGISDDETRPIPAHGARGRGHVAFACAPEDLPRWRAHLESRGVAVEATVPWEQGGASLYLRDPAGNSVEFAPPTLWGGGWDF